MTRLGQLFIVGAGFSAHAGLPLTSEFTEALLAGAKSDPTDRVLVEFLRKFIGSAFDHNIKARAEFWPSLEDLFTSVDLAANSGHHLGKYSPRELRTVRRALIVRSIRMLHQRYEERGTDQWFDAFFSGLDLDHSAFISMNWDCVIERQLERIRKLMAYDYGIDAEAGRFNGRGVELAKRSGKAHVQLLKLHGSVNWLYCDNCRRVYWFEPTNMRGVTDRLLTATDYEIIKEVVSVTPPRGLLKKERVCPRCGTAALGTRLATFSFRKSLEFPMFQRGWLSAERLLRESDAWVFIGYSMPAADYEFKHLLKRVQLGRKSAPRLVLVTGCRRADETYENYQTFLGRGISRKTPRSFWRMGLDKEAIEGLMDLGVLQRLKSSR